MSKVKSMHYAAKSMAVEGSAAEFLTPSADDEPPPPLPVIEMSMASASGFTGKCFSTCFFFFLYL